MSAFDSYCFTAGIRFTATAASSPAGPGAHAELGLNSLISRIERVIPVVLSQVSILVL
ncbi:MAG: hypothetical protein HGA70_06770 [Chlorobiaceae bacterium]|nr:hypothetical protein [Chlorobiaceae bacterium]NTW10865.1 hypothetical protein [Chlorobiaceae bacterium]